jgi:hypothetical protein
MAYFGRGCGITGYEREHLLTAPMFMVMNNRFKVLHRIIILIDRLLTCADGTIAVNARYVGKSRSDIIRRSPSVTQCHTT